MVKIYISYNTIYRAKRKVEEMGAHSVIFGIIPIINFTLTKSKRAPELASFVREYRFSRTEKDLVLYTGGALTGLTNRLPQDAPAEKSIKALMLDHKTAAPRVIPKAPLETRIRI